ncbi:MAG: lytic murein transglycosylase [Proteobacteria bacterium]|nr:lytic murein transglycosylase [Pseudomonadota bacterium]
MHCAALIAGCLAAGLAAGAPAPPAPAAAPAIRTDDVARFYDLYEREHGHPTALQLEREYLAPGSEGLHEFARLRAITGEAIATAIERRPEVYAGARRCVAALPRVTRRLAVALRRLGELYPAAQFPAVTIAVGRGKPVGIGSPATGIQIGLEALCATDWLNPDVEARFVHVIAHEYVHAQQVRRLVDDEHPTVLEASLVEGIAEFVGERISGSIANAYLPALAHGREREIETAFVADEDRTDLSAWVYNSTPERPADLGYWVGYRIARSYYRHAADRRRAIADLIRMDDPRALLARSGWHPGIHLD